LQITVVFILPVSICIYRATFIMQSSYNPHCVAFKIIFNVGCGWTRDRKITLRVGLSGL